MSSYLLQLPEELMEEARRLATENQISLDQWLLAAIAEKAEAERTVSLLRHFAERANYAHFDKVLERVPDVEPIPGDEL